MKKVLIYSILLILGLGASQMLPLQFGDAWTEWSTLIRALTMIGLAFIMIHVGYEFDIDKRNVRQYGWDYVVAMTAAAFPWIFVTLYFVFVMLPSETWGNFDAWKETLLAGRFAAPTSAGVLFSMLVAAGLGATWLYRKARILAIFDDLDTVLLMIPLKMLMVGMAWQLGLIVILMVVLLWIAWVWLHRISIPVSWPWVLGYAAFIGIGSEFIHAGSKLIDDSVPIHIEVLLPAFVLGCVMRRRGRSGQSATEESAEPQSSDMPAHDHHDDILESPGEKRVATIISAAFMVLVGLNMPLFVDGGERSKPSAAIAADTSGSTTDDASLMLSASGPGTGQDGSETSGATAAGVSAGIPAKAQSASLTADQPVPGWGVIALHVLVITIISNLGKMFPAFCYRREAHWRERLAVAIGMWPRGEVGAGVLVVSLSYGIGGPIVTVAMLSLALNLVLTGVFIVIVKRLIRDLPARSEEGTRRPRRGRPSNTPHRTINIHNPIRHHLEQSGYHTRCSVSLNVIRHNLDSV